MHNSAVYVLTCEHVNPHVLATGVWSSATIKYLRCYAAERPFKDVLRVTPNPCSEYERI